MHATEPRTEKKFTTLTKRCKMIPRLLQIIKQGKDDPQEQLLALDGTRGHRGRRRRTRFPLHLHAANGGSSTTDTIQTASMIRIPAH